MKRNNGFSIASLLVSFLMVTMLLPFLSVSAKAYNVGKAVQNATISVISAGEKHTAAITKDGALYTWGSNGVGELGNGEWGLKNRWDYKNSTIPVKIMDDVDYVSLGDGNSSAITKDGSLYIWGSCSLGTDGKGILSGNLVRPHKIMDNVIAVSKSGTAALTKDNTLYMWGSNAHGEMGIGEQTSYAGAITKVMDNVSMVSAFYRTDYNRGYHTAVITVDGVLYTWGNNSNGQLGNGMTIDSYVPVKVMENVIAVSAGYTHTTAITTDGVLYAWGDNSCGQLGNGMTTDSYVPVKVMENVVAVSAGYLYTAAITSEGVLYEWGGGVGQLNGTKIDSPIPMQVMENVFEVDAGHWHTVAVTTDGTLYTWGSNDSGQLGNGTTSLNFSHPTKIMDNIKLPPDEDVELPSKASLTFDEKSYSVEVGESVTLSATFLSKDAPTDMVWTCNNPDAVTLTGCTSVLGPFPDKETTHYISQQMVGNKAGTYEITLTASGLTATTTLTITDDTPPKQENAIRLSKNAYSLQADEIGAIVADWKYPHANASTIHWSVSGNAIKESPEAIAEPVFADGSPAPQDSFRFKGVHTGQATITATLPSGESDSCVVTVEDVNPYYLVIIPYSGVSVQEGDKTEIQATVCATDTQRAVDDRELEAVTSIVWESSNGDFVAFDKDGKTREESDHISHGLFGNKADAVKIYGRARGKSEVSCTVQINGYTISKSVTASVNSKETNEMIKLIGNWTDAYAKYITALEKYLEKDSEKDNAIPVDEMGKLLMEADFNHPETRLVQFTNSVLNQRAATGTDQLTMRTYVYQGVAQFLADKGSGAFPKIKAKDVSDVFGFASEIATAACNYVDTAPYSCTFYHNGEAVSVKIQGISAGAAHMREILYNDQKVADMISSVDEIMAVLIDYGTKLCELSREVIKQAYKEALKELFSKDISGLMEESVKKRVEDSLGNYIGRFSETGINDVVKDVQYCFDYYGHLKTLFSASASDPKSILDAMGKLNFKSNPANVKDYSVKRAMKSIKKAGSSLEDFLKKAVVKDGGDYGQFLTDVYDIMFHFHCPITIAVYSGDVQVGLLSEDDIWYDSNVVYIEQYGEEKNVYAHSGTALRFEVVGTDEGTLDYIVEEFQDGKSIQRLNYYDINLYEGKTVSISVSGATITEDDAVLSESDGRLIFCDETLTSNDYEAASVLISSLASPRRGGQVQGCGSYVRGDRIALRAIPENGFLFDGWRNDDGELVSLDRVYEFTAREDVSLTAMFAEDAEEISEPDSVAITSATLDKADGLKVCAVIQCPENVNATVYCAFYKSNGQMVSIEVESLKAGENDLTLPVDSSAVAVAKLFVLDEQFVPLCQCVEIEIS